MKVLIVVACEVPTPEDVPGIIVAMDPPNIPHFTGDLRVVVEPHATELTSWLDE